mmetsp:Transcript_15180/g.29359  ORF Transcript_15180/g.29359 Transcript_15180/m.29359 type:complete len:256 (+) Transcript_15180:357-1124(+)|eukprot:CAMPEP_0182611418 /NCGR_PEP_ID=MMETSP1330-20130603/13867_1 /TAXON_ID=464278 /ORGANISM="Picochlorum sp., Strain RCC944" /LENGTH=255 /DNA_ID=CAMNT_0024830813 /DNA_START=115 /DNA_END=882 /DNA_ORIENTATION=-
MKTSITSLLLLAMLGIAGVSAQEPPKADTKKKTADPLSETFEGKGTFGVESALCDGEGEFSGEAEYTGEGEFMSEGGTFDGEGIFFISGGTFKASNPEELWTCEGSGTFVLPGKTAQAKFSGNGTITGAGTFSTQTGTFKGDGTYEGNQVIFTNKHALKSNLTIEALRVTEQSGDQPAKNVHILGSGIGSFIGIGEFQGQGTCKGNGTLHGSGTLKGEGSLVGSGTLKGKGSMNGSGTFEGKGKCSGVSVRYYEN